MGRKSGNQPRNEKGQYASYGGLGASAAGASPAECSRRGKKSKYAPVASADSVPEQETLGIAGKRIDAAQDHNRPKFPRFFPSEMYNDTSDSSDDIDGIIDEVDEVFAEAKKMISDDPAKVNDALDLVYEGVLGPSLVLKSKRGKEAAKKKSASKPPHK